MIKYSPYFSAQIPEICPQIIFMFGMILMPVPVATRSRAWVCGCSLAGTVGSNPTGGADVCLLLVLFVVRYSSLRRADNSPKGVLWSLVCLWWWSFDNGESLALQSQWCHGNMWVSWQTTNISAKEFVDWILQKRFSEYLRGRNWIIKYSWHDFFFPVALRPTWAMASFLRFLDHTQRRITVGRTPLDEWSARRGYLYLITHNTDKRQSSMPPVGFEPTISAGERSQTYALDRAATGTGYSWHDYQAKINQHKVQSFKFDVLRAVHRNIFL